MKSLQYIKWTGLFFLSVLISVGCKKLVEVGTPSNSLVSSDVFSNDNTAIAAQLGVYTHMQNYSMPYSLSEATGLSADELITYSTDQTLNNLYKNHLSAGIDGGVKGYWQFAYYIIYQENAIIENVQRSTALSDSVKRFTLGEAKLVRSWWYFELVNLFGNVPYVTSTDYTANATLATMPKDQVYQHIIQDLQEAKNQLSVSFRNAADAPGTAERARPTVWAADALLARIYLYNTKYDSAEQQASLVIGNSLFSLVSELNDVFKMNSTEAIWQLEPSVNATVAPEGQDFIITTPPSASGFAHDALIAPLLNAFEPNDMRKAKWIGSYTQDTSTWYFPFKYKYGYGYTGTLQEYSMVIRLAELYLIRAEARAQLGETNAADDLNAIRHRANLPDYAGPANKDPLLAAIMHERQVELFTEGHRWFDLKRTKTIDTVMGGPSGACVAKTTTWQSYQQLYPINPNDILLDPNISQTPGY